MGCKPDYLPLDSNPSGGVAPSLQLSKPCHHCDGEGQVEATESPPDDVYIPEAGRWEVGDVLWCAECDGEGLVLTRAGRELIRFVRRWETSRA